MPGRGRGKSIVSGMQKHCTIRITGRVTGVGFRYYAAEKARELGIAGFVRNERDESVLIEAEGEESALQELIRWCKEGSHPGDVSRVERSFSDELKQYKDFTIQHIQVCYFEGGF